MGAEQDQGARVQQGYEVSVAKRPHSNETNHISHPLSYVLQSSMAMTLPPDKLHEILLLFRNPTAEYRYVQCVPVLGHLISYLVTLAFRGSCVWNRKKAWVVGEEEAIARHGSLGSDSARGRGR